MIQEYWKVQKKKFDKGLLLPVVYEDCCLEKITHMHSKGKISTDDLESLQMTFIQSLLPPVFPPTTTTTTTDNNDSVDVSIKKFLARMYAKGSISVSVLEDVYLEQLRACHEQGRITTAELESLQRVFTKEQQLYLNE